MPVDASQSSRKEYKPVEFRDINVNNVDVVSQLLTLPEINVLLPSNWSICWDKIFSFLSYQFNKTRAHIFPLEHLTQNINLYNQDYFPQQTTHDNQATSCINMAIAANSIYKNKQSSTTSASFHFWRVIPTSNTKS